jgi:arsenite/tail-anchored protein-transporting ATPase
MPRADNPTSVMFFSGKGGVGKTTLAAATAVHLARQGKRVLIFSTDPAHSLADVFGQPLTGEPRQLANNLKAMEVDAKGLFAEVLDHEQLGDGLLARLARLASSSPGVDEFGAVEALLEALNGQQHDVVILDTAPTGHTLRLLLLPELMEGWLGTLLEFRGQIARAGRMVRRMWPGAKRPGIDEGLLEQGLQGGRDQIRALTALLRDTERSRVVLVTIPEAMSVLETTRTLEFLQRHGVAVGPIVVNQLQPEQSSCPHCFHRRAMHLEQLPQIEELANDLEVRVIESEARDIRGLEALARLGAQLWAE